MTALGLYTEKEKVINLFRTPTSLLNSFFACSKFDYSMMKRMSAYHIITGKGGRRFGDNNRSKNR